ncbi:MAG: hypothetical protein PVJ39_18170 [Gammaproteobacteria bacterium]|jgi:Ca2+-binding EF-hand superfamily protein
MNTSKLLLLAGITAAVSLPAVLNAEEMEQSSKFNQLDKDGDGYISIQEATGENQLLKQWVEVDKNTDGQLEAAEFSAFEEMAPATRFTPADESYEPEPGAGPMD